MASLRTYLKHPKIQRVLSRMPNEEGFSLVELVVVIAVLAILSAVAVPAFVGVQANAKAAAVKNGLVNGIKECIVRDADGNPDLDFADANSFANASAYQGYTVQMTGANDSCFSGEAVPEAQYSNDYATFIAVMDTATGVVTKSCTVPGGGTTAPGCPASGEW